MQTNGLIAKVHVGGTVNGQNPLHDMRTVLTRLGVTATPVIAHHHHFHIYLRPPAPLVLSRLDAATAAPESAALGGQQEISTSTTGDPSMLLNLFEPPTQPSAGRAEYAIIAQANITQGTGVNSKEKFDMVFDECQAVETQVPPGGLDFSPNGGVMNYWDSYPKHRVGSGILRDAKVTVLQGPSLGTLVPLSRLSRDFGQVFAYELRPGVPNGSEDRISFLIEFEGKRIKVNEILKIVFNSTPESKDCKGKDYYIKRISQVDGAPDGSTVLGSQFISMDLLRGSTESGVTYRFADQQGSALGTAAVQGSNTTITLDPTAAGYGWFIDNTPGDNSEFLPTSNPNEWVAKESSAAFGKMDMLSVLLHEYGHVLGIEHSHDAHDFMATTLQPGVRRTLTVDQQIELMALAGYFPVPDSPSQPYGPTDPGVPLPFTRTTSSRFGRMRPNFGQGRTEFDTVASPKLESPDFTDGSAWATQGDVAFEHGAATLKETSTTQTRLNQVFVVGDHDRFLSFTLSGLGLSDQAAGPDDAFEVALIDATTGAALLGNTGLSKSDAFLNLQANGNERKASAVSRLQNADGSRTYLVDLAGIAAGTVVNLSFDLIGFGKGFEANNS